MAKLKAPLFSFRASGKLADALVFFGWKGLNVVRSYVVPANPQTTLQTTQRGHLTDAVTAIHAAEARAVGPLSAVDKTAYALYGSTEKTPRTWFNQIVARWCLAATHTEFKQMFADGTFTDPATTEITFEVEHQDRETVAGFMYAGTSKTSLPTKVAADGVAFIHTGVFTGLTKGVKYFFQFRATAQVDDKYVARSGIYHHICT